MKTTQKKQITEKEAIFLLVTLMMLTNGNKKKVRAIFMTLSYIHPHVYIKYPGKGVKYAAAVAQKLQSVHDKAATSTWLAGAQNLITILAALKNAITNLLILNAAAKGGSTDDKTKQKSALSDIMTAGTQDIINLVQGVIYLNKDKAQDVTASVDMMLKAGGGRDELQWSVTRISKGTVQLVGHVKGLKCRYLIQWQMSQTPDVSESWYLQANEIIPTTVAKKDVPNLPLGKEVFFRYRIVIGTKDSEWSDVISLFIS